MKRFNNTCKEVTRLLIAREDRALDWPDRIAMGIHMKICHACPIFELQVVTMRNALGQWKNDTKTVVDDEPGQG
jgi:hypothetical protein